MSRKVAVVYEAAADFAIATDLADRVLVEAVDWLDETLLDSQREWVGGEPAGRLTWKGIPARARGAGIRVRGHFNGEPGLPDAQAARRALAYLRLRFEDLEAVVLMRDADDQPERRQGLEQARAMYPTGYPIVIGVAICERESWVISGFEPRDEAEADRLAAERTRLGFSPCDHSHQLTACKDDTALKSPKRVLAALSADDGRREQDCWRVTRLDVLRARGGGNGLALYLEEVRTRLVPLVTG